MKNNIIKPSILAGFMELLPKNQKKFDDIVSKIKAVYEENGCEAIDTPIIEKSEVLLAKSGGETEKQVYSFEKGKNKMALRFDLTVPFARYTAQHFDELAFPFRRYQIGKVYRGERNQRGRYRELYQYDVDVIGKNSLSINNDAWVINLADRAFKAIGLTSYKFQISNRKILKGILSELEIERENDVMTLIDKYDKIGEKCFNDELTKVIGSEQAEIINNIISIEGSSDETIKRLSEFKFSNETFIEGIKELEKVTNILSCLGVSSDKFTINLKIIRGLDYYTGTVFEFTVDSIGAQSTVCGGGRYDGLLSSIGGPELPAVGFGMGITRLIQALKDEDLVPEFNNGCDVYIAPLGENATLPAFILAQKLKEAGVAAETDLCGRSLKAQMKYADKAGASYVLVVGDDEIQKNSAELRNMGNGERAQVELTAEKIAEMIK